MQLALRDGHHRDGFGRFERLLVGFKTRAGCLGKANGLAVHVHFETNFALSQIAKWEVPAVAEKGFARGVQRIEGFRVFALQVVKVSEIVITNRGQPDLP